MVRALTTISFYYYECKNKLGVFFRMCILAITLRLLRKFCLLRMLFRFSLALFDYKQRQNRYIR